MRPAGIRQAKHLGDLVEGFAGGVVERFPEHLVAPDAIGADQLAVAARNQQGEKGKRQPAAFEQRREQMPLHVVDAEGGDAKPLRQRAPDGSPHEQGADEPGAGGIGDAAEIIEREAGVGEHFPDQGQCLAHMVSRRQFGNNATVTGMNPDLAVKPVREQTPLAAIQPDAGLVARGFNAQNNQALRSAETKRIASASSTPVVKIAIFMPPA